MEQHVRLYQTLSKFWYDYLDTGFKYFYEADFRIGIEKLLVLKFSKSPWFEEFETSALMDIDNVGHYYCDLQTGNLVKLGIK